MEPRTVLLKDGTGVLVREVEVADASSVLEYLDAISEESNFLTFGPGEFSLTVAEEEAHTRRIRESENQHFMLAECDGRIVGLLHFEASPRARVRHRGEFGMSVARDFWGLGLGSHMLDALIDWARGTGIIKKINLRVRTDNNRAIRLYNSKGFALEGTMRREFFVDGQYYDLYWMGLDL